LVAAFALYGIQHATGERDAFQWGFIRLTEEVGQSRVEVGWVPIHA
jgi:hypothetical protein